MFDRRKEPVDAIERGHEEKKERTMRLAKRIATTAGPYKLGTREPERKGNAEPDKKKVRKVRKAN